MASDGSASRLRRYSVAVPLGIAATRSSTMTIACPDCGTLQELPELAPGVAAVCPTCEHRLERTSGRSHTAALLFAVATFILLFPANIDPLMKICILGIERETRISSGVFTLWNDQWVLFAVLIAVYAVVLPFVRFALLTFVLTCTHSGWRPDWLGRLYRWSLQLDIWAMPDVLLIGAAVG